MFGDCPAALIAKVWVTGMAATKLVLSPGCEAVIVQAPEVTNVALVPLTVQTDVVLEVNATG